MKTVLLSLLLLVAASVSAAAQGGTGTLDILVRDLNGNPITGATVSANYSKRVGSRILQFKADSAGRLLLRGLPLGSYELHAYKEAEGYPDTFFSFFATGNKDAWRFAEVYADRTTNVVLKLGPKYAKLNLTIKNEQGNWVGASVIFNRPDQPHPLTTGARELLVPPVPFRFEVAADGYLVWKSKLLRPRSNETVEVSVRLIRSPK